MLFVFDSILLESKLFRGARLCGRESTGIITMTSVLQTFHRGLPG